MSKPVIIGDMIRVRPRYGIEHYYIEVKRDAYENADFIVWRDMEKKNLADADETWLAVSAALLDMMNELKKDKKEFRKDIQR